MAGWQDAAVTVGYVAAASAPSLATPLLADAAGDAVDGRALRFLVWGALETLEQAGIMEKAEEGGGPAGDGGGEEGGGGVLDTEEKEKEEEDMVFAVLVVVLRQIPIVFLLRSCSSWTRLSSCALWCKGWVLAFHSCIPCRSGCGRARR